MKIFMFICYLAGITICQASSIIFEKTDTADWKIMYAQGEICFQKRQFLKALESYQRALQLHFSDNIGTCRCKLLLPKRLLSKEYQAISRLFKS